MSRLKKPPAGPTLSDPEWALLCQMAFMLESLEVEEPDGTLARAPDAIRLSELKAAASKARYSVYGIPRVVAICGDPILRVVGEGA